ncbi:MAG: diguanylate cyclase domain-containing protein, partial [Acidothermaceae bacterium]
MTSDRTSRRSLTPGTTPAAVGKSLAVLLVVALVASIGGCALGVPSGTHLIGSWISVLGLVLAGALATVALIARGWGDATYRRSWLLLAVAPMAETAWLASALIPVFRHGALLSEPAGDVGHLLAVPFVIAALLGLPTPEHDRRTRLRTGLDVVAAAFAFGALTYNFGIPSGTNHLGTLQPLFGMALGTAVVAALARARYEGGLPLNTLLTVVSGIFVVGVSDTLAAFHLNHAGWSAQDPYLAIGAVGHLLLAWGSLHASDTRDSVATMRRREQVAVMAPIVPILPVGVVVLVSILVGARLALMTLILLGLLVASVLVAAVLARIDQLVLSRTLEHRVVERTLALRTHAKWFRSLVQNSSDVITIVDASGTIRYQTPSASRVLGYDPAAMVGRRFGALLGQADASRLEATLVDAALRPRSSQTVEFAMMHSDGHWCETETVVTSLVDDHDIRGLVLNTRDVSERKELERQLTRQAFSDSLTGLANRALFRNRVEHAIDERTGSAGHVAVLFLDLDGFKAVNDAQGHLVGDNLLTLVADRLRHCVGPGDTVARLGGDEFAILIVGADAERVARQVADRVRQVLAQPFVLDGREVTLAASTGIAVTDGGTETADQILRNADLAMY